MANTLLDNTFDTYKSNIESSDIACGLGQDIVSKDKKKVFLKAGTPVTDKINTQIHQLKADGVIGESKPDDTIAITHPIQPEELSQSLIENIKSNPVLTQYELKDTLHVITDYIEAGTIPQKLMEHFTVFSKNNPQAFKHTLSNLVFGTHIGKANKYSNQQLHELMTVLFYEDIGYSRLDLRLKNAYKVHPILSKEIVEYAGITNPLILESILQHEEKLDGSGYPNQLTEIHEYAQISQLANQHSTLVEQGDDVNCLLGKLYLMGCSFDFRTGDKKPVLFQPKLQKAILTMMQEKLKSPEQLNRYAQHLHKELTTIIKWSQSEVSTNNEVLSIQQKINSALWVSETSQNPFQIKLSELKDKNLCQAFMNDAMHFIHHISEAVDYLNCGLHKPVERNGSPISGSTCLTMANPLVF